MAEPVFLAGQDGPLPASPMKGEVPASALGTIEDRASTLHLPLHGGGREGAVSISMRKRPPLRATDLATYAILIAGAVVMLLPFAWMVSPR